MLYVSEGESTVDIHMFMPDFQAMRDDLVRLGFEELRTPDAVNAKLASAKGVTLLAINSVCGCAGGIARPAAALALREVRPDNLMTVFAGQDKEATAAARALFPEYPPSSPSFAVFKDGKVVDMIPRSEIEGSDPHTVARRIVGAVQRAQG